MKIHKQLMWALCSTLICLALMFPESVRSEEKSAEQIDLSYITPNAMFASVTYPQRVLAYPQLELFPHEVITAAGLKEAGIDPHDVVNILGVVELPAGFPIPGYGVVCKLSKPYSVENILPALQEKTLKEERDGGIYYRAQSPVIPSFFMPDDQTLIVATEAMMGMMLDAHKNKLEGALKQHAAKELSDCDMGYSVLLDPIRPLMMAQLQNAPVPPPFEAVKEIPELVKAIDMKTGFLEEFYISATIHSPDAKAAEQLEKTLNHLVDLGKKAFLAEMAKTPSSDPVEQAGQQYAARLMSAMSESIQPKRVDDRLTISGEGNSLATMGTIGTLTSLLLPAVQKAREAARRTQSQNNLKMIALSMHNYEAAYRTFPTSAITDDKGNPLLSWRVELLPYLDEQDLYDQFHLDEPWDSEHNRKLIPLMPDVFKNPNSSGEEFKTNYLLPVGMGMMFNPNKGIKIPDIIDGTVNTIMTVEADDSHAVIWTKPQDLNFDPEQPLSGLGNLRAGMFMVGFADGSVQGIDNSIDEKILRALFTPAGGEKLGF